MRAVEKRSSEPEGIVPLADLPADGVPAVGQLDDEAGGRPLFRRKLPDVRDDEDDGLRGTLVAFVDLPKRRPLPGLELAIVAILGTKAKG